MMAIAHRFHDIQPARRVIDSCRSMLHCLLSLLLIGSLSLAIALGWGVSGAIAADQASIPPVLEAAMDAGVQDPPPSLPESVEPAASDIAEPSPNEAKPIKRYFLHLLPDQPRQRITLDPPATRIRVTLKSGSTAVRCGDGQETFSCVPGKPLIIERNDDEAIAQFWAQSSDGGDVSLRIAVFQQVETPDSAR